MRDIPYEVPSDEHDARLRIEWSPIYHPEWDATPQAYVAAGLVGGGRSRRLAKVHDPAYGFTSYLGMRHFDPARWNLPGLPTATFFASFFVRGRTIGLRTYPTMGEALAAAQAFHARLAGAHGG